MKGFFQHLVEKAEHIENTCRNSLCIWHVFLIAFYIYVLCSEAIGVGAAIYCYIGLFISCCQMCFRFVKIACSDDWKIIIVRSQAVFCIFNMLNSVLQIFPAIKQEYFEIDGDFSLLFVRLLCLQSAFYYFSIMLCIATLFFRYRRRSQSGITEAILVDYETARVDKWLKNHYPQISAVEIRNTGSDSDISTSSENSEENSDCSICLDTFQKSEIICRLKCKHYYHVQCIVNWLKHRNSRGVCPLCKDVNRLEVSE